MRRLMVITALLFLLQGAAASAIPKDFDPHTIPIITLGNYPPSLKVGVGFIEGYLKAKTQLFGDLTYGNEDVLLLPATDFSMWYIDDVAYMMENPYAKDTIANYPTDLVKYTRVVRSDKDGYFRFKGLPDGRYYVWSYLEHEVDSHPTRERTQLAIGADGNMVSIPTFRKGLKIRTDNVVIAGDAVVDSTSGYPGDKIDSFVVVGEFTCCSAEL